MTDAAVELHCSCGATRVAPAGLRSVSCIKCGRELYAPLAPAALRPSIAILALAAFASQIVAAAILCLAVASLAQHAASTELVVCGAVALIGVLAGGSAYRGSVTSLLVAGLIDAAIAGASLARTGALVELDRVQGLFDPAQLSLALTVTGTIAAVACALAIPQAKRYVAWQREQIERAIHTKRL